MSMAVGLDGHIVISITQRGDQHILGLPLWVLGWRFLPAGFIRVDWSDITGHYTPCGAADGDEHPVQGKAREGGVITL